MGSERHRTATSTRLIVTVGAIALVAACGESVRSDSETAEAGAGASGPSGGRVGNPSGGRGGQSPSGGAGGCAPARGSGGTAGCSEDVCVDSLGHCPANPLEGGQPRSSCTFEATCDAFRCGDPWSDFDENGCRRLHCSSQQDCAGTERCVPAVLGGRFDCYSSVYESCRESSGTCVCGWSDDCATAAFCQPVATFPHENDCRFDAEPCETLPDILAMLGKYAGGTYAADIEATLEACADTVARRIDECEGGGGAPGF